MARVLTLIGVLLAWCAIPAVAAAAEPAGRSLAELRRDDARLAYELQDLARQMAWARDRLDVASGIRDEAVVQLTQQVIATYIGDGTSSTLLGSLLAGRSLDDVIAQLGARQQLDRYTSRLVDELDQAADAALADAEDAQRIQARIMRATRERERVQDEIRQHLAAEQVRARERARKQAERETRQREQLASLVSLGGAPLMAAGSVSGEQPVVPASAVSAASIDSYLFSKRSPMAGQGTYILMSAARWGIDPRLIVAIAGAESNFGAITCGAYNAWGWACPNSPAQFSSWADGIETISEGLRRYYIDEGRTTVPLIQQKWAPSGAANDPTGLNNHWVGNVSRFLRELGGAPSSLATSGPAIGAGAALGLGPLG
jgi:hypothetical protein